MGQTRRRLGAQHAAHERIVRTEVALQERERVGEIGLLEVFERRDRGQQVLLQTDQRLIRVLGKAFAVGLGSLCRGADQRDGVADQALLEEVTAHREVPRIQLGALDHDCGEIVPGGAVLGREFGLGRHGRAQLGFGVDLGLHELRIE